MKTNLNEVLEHTGNPPIVVRTICEKPGVFMQGGAMGGTKHNYHYVLVSALPDDLQQRIHLAVQALVSSV